MHRASSSSRSLHAAERVHRVADDHHLRARRVSPSRRPRRGRGASRFAGARRTQTGSARRQPQGGDDVDAPGRRRSPRRRGTRRASAAWPAPAWAPSVPMTSNPSTARAPEQDLGHQVAQAGVEVGRVAGPTCSLPSTAARMASSARGDGPRSLAIQPRSAHSRRSRAMAPSR